MCTSPLVRFRLKRGISTSKITFATSTSFVIKSLKYLQSFYPSYSAFKSDFDIYYDYQFIKCRKCDECREQYANDWAVRCAGELFMRKCGCFVTFTIDDVMVPKFFEEKYMKTYCKRCVKGNRYIKYPINYTLCKHLILDTIKRLRDRLYKKYKINIRYFGCGEYGSSENTERPHYHVILFGYNPPDKTFYKMSDKGFIIYHSEELQESWPFGIVTVQDVDFNVAQYTAKYCMKKVSSDCCDEVKNDIYYGREPEFLFMSKGNCQSNRCPYIDEIIKNCKGMSSLRDLNNPYCKNCNKTRGGLGYDYFQYYYRDIFKVGHISIGNLKFNIPKYYLDLLKLTDPELYDKYKLKQLDFIDNFENLQKDFRSVERNEVRAKINKAKKRNMSRL